MFQSGLLFTDPNPYCDEIDYCTCQKSSIKYNQSFWTKNIVSEFDLICDQQADIKTSDLFYYSGITVGCLFSFGLGIWVIRFSEVSQNQIIVLFITQVEKTL